MEILKAEVHGNASKPNRLTDPRSPYPYFPLPELPEFSESNLAAILEHPDDCAGCEKMAQMFFQCSNTRGALFHACRAEVTDLVEAQEYAACVVNSLIMEPTVEDWRGWTLHVSDDDGLEIFALPFMTMLGKPH